MPPTTLIPPNNGYQRNHLKVGKPLVAAILTKNALFRSYGTFAYLPRAHIRNINNTSLRVLDSSIERIVLKT